ncbi:MAG: DUF3592 domain-containing protein [Acidobacteria bacterium]|nr:DUF3592 domain-containing protein [Acidobacteriota bacterium]
MKPNLQHVAQLLHGHDQIPIGSIALAGAAVAVAGGMWWYARAHRTPSEELERRRREALANSGRITDGVILDARSLNNEESVSATPEVLVYSYSVAGMTYNCAQDVSPMPQQVLGFRIDQPVQVRYDPRNPGNSIIVSETWTGLWLPSAAGKRS